MYTTVNGRLVGYDESGSGMPLVLIHGYPLNRMMWEAQWEGLTQSARVLAPDMRGFGESEMVDAPVQISTYAEDVHEFLQAMGIQEPAVICGLSMGGYIALAYLGQYPEQVAGLVLANTKATPDSGEAKAGRNKNIALAQAKGADAIAEGILPKMLAPQTYAANAELVEQVKHIMASATVTGIVGALSAMRDRPDSIYTLEQSSTPTLIIAGTDDQLMPMAEQDKMKQAARNSTLVVIPDAGHLSPMEQPDAFNAALAEFLNTLKP
ncbi:MAG: alpha/beta hydrolase [Chloroflexi bacterium]|nr:alpha/beta hydrolase [Chloroflexota bacterium]